jgi:hypothetical protein
MPTLFDSSVVVALLADEPVGLRVVGAAGG